MERARHYGDGRLGAGQRAREITTSRWKHQDALEERGTFAVARRDVGPVADDARARTAFGARLVDAWSVVQLRELLRDPSATPG